jgi:drug/metabolite transporter (DMT)-like permease
LGTAVIVFSIVLSSNLKHRTHLTPRRLWAGIGVGILSMAAMALGIIIMKPVLNKVPLIHVVFIRLLAGIFLLWLNLLFLRHRRLILRSLFHRHGFEYTLLASFIGGFVVLLIWMAGFKYAEAAVAAALNQMSNVFIFLFGAFILKEHIDGKKIFSICLAVSGALLVTFG